MSKTLVAVIGGTGLNQWADLKIESQRSFETPYGAPSAPIAFGRVEGFPVAFMPRHGDGHKVPPHRINYRANLWALREAGIRAVVAVAAVGGIAPWMPPAAVAVPSDIIDYTWGRAHTYSDDGESTLQHVDFTEPYSERIRRELVHSALALRIDVADGGVMGVTQGPRLESPAEIKRLKRDGCDMVGMTGMPEAALARELGLHYACLAVCVNWAAGIGRGDIHAEIEQSLDEGMGKVRDILTPALRLIGTRDEQLEV